MPDLCPCGLPLPCEAHVSLFVYCQRVVGLTETPRSGLMFCQKKAVPGTGLCLEHSDGRDDA